MATLSVPFICHRFTFAAIVIIPILHDTNGQRSVSKMASYRSEARNDAILVTGAVHNTSQLVLFYDQTRQRPTQKITGLAKPAPVHRLVGRMRFREK
jgi:hypothetical protein